VGTQSYQVNLGEHLADCELNYLRLQRLLPRDCAVGSRQEFGLVDATVQLLVTECAPYTTSLEVRLSRPAVAVWRSPVLSVQSYHDAAMAEVVAVAGIRVKKPRLPYPNPAMLQRDEKRQLNRYLGEILRHCLSLGHSMADPLKILEI
jgi:uncharacterized protein